jgi:hypothetical protein
LRDKKKEDQEDSGRKKKSVLNSHLQHNRKLISEFKRHNGKNKKNRSSMNK